MNAQGPSDFGIDRLVSQYYNMLQNMRLHIIAKAKQVLIETGLACWTLDLVASRSGCAKGLVFYHHKSRTALLALVAAQMRRDRLARRIAALTAPGPAAIDALWQTIESETASGETAPSSACSNRPWMVAAALPASC